jgi:Homeodomain-like domain
MTTTPDQRMTPNLVARGKSLARARAGLAREMELARQEAVAADGEGVPQAVIARELGVTRMTVWKWFGGKHA